MATIYSLISSTCMYGPDIYLYVDVDDKLDITHLFFILIIQYYQHIYYFLDKYRNMIRKFILFTYKYTIDQTQIFKTTPKTLFFIKIVPPS